MNRMKKALLAVVFALLAFSGQSDARPGTWAYYKAHFISSDGRIIDYHQNRISHSEGQGYGLLLALSNNDKSTFQTINNWTQRNLKVRQDALFAWSWGKRITGDWGVIDYNNATDGDILIAWALMDAGEKWHRPDYTASAREIIETVKQLLVVQRKQSLLLPSYFGFDHGDEINLNPSYFVYPAFARFARSDDAVFWERLYADCLELSRRSSYTRLKLPADWVTLDKTGQPSMVDNKKGRFGYEAIRVPLYLALARETTVLESFKAYVTLVEQLNYLPLSVNLFDETVSLKEAPAGFYAIMGLCSRLIGHKAAADDLFAKAAAKITYETDDYYSNTLYLLAMTGVTP
jgi:endo-1,4-beta-D-glucanase Y